MIQYAKQLHDNYKRSVLAFCENYKRMDDEVINQIDSFCRMCALYLWGSFDVSEDECVRALMEVYTKNKSDYSREEVAKILSAVRIKKGSIKIPVFLEILSVMIRNMVLIIVEFLLMVCNIFF